MGELSSSSARSKDLDELELLTQPAPSLKSTLSLKSTNNCRSEQSAEAIRDGVGGVHRGDTQRHLLASVVGREDEESSGKEGL